MKLHDRWQLFDDFALIPIVFCIAIDSFQISFYIFS